MAETNFPNGLTVSSGHVGNVTPSVTATGKREAWGTVTVPSGTAGTAFATGLTTVEYVVACPYTTVTPVATFAGVAVEVGDSGAITIRGVSSAGTPSTTSGTASWRAVGT